MSAIRSLVILLTIFVPLVIAFNSERLPKTNDEDQTPEIDPNAIYPVYQAKDLTLEYPESIEIAPIQEKKETKHRHMRSKALPKQKDLPEDVLDIFGLPPQTDIAGKSKRQAFFPPPFFALPYTPTYSQNTYVPNGNQINNYYSQLYPFPPNPYGIPLFIPILFCLKPQQTPPTGQTDTETKPAVDDRFNFPDDPILNTLRPRPSVEQPPVERPVERPEDQYVPPQVENTPTGISLEPVRPSRPNFQPPPPIQHGSGSSQSAYNPQLRPNNVRPYPENNARPQNERPQRPQTTQRPFTTQPPRRPASSENSPQGTGQSGETSPCVFAIVNCCGQNYSERQRQLCFARNGCPGAFWGVDPCDTDLARAARSTLDELGRS